jgi:ATP-dependent helicase/nuclease subunit B
VSADYQTVKKWSELLSSFARLGVVIPQMTYAEALARLRRLAAATEFQPETGAAPVQILGLLETFGMQFEHLWIAGLDDERWPEPARPAPFLPVALQRLRGMPRSSPERALAFAQRTTERLLASAPDIVVSHARRDGDRELAPSPLILGIPEEPLEMPDYPSYLGVVRESSLLESIEDHTAPPFQDAAAPGGVRVFEFQAQCPFRAFAELRLDAEPLETPAPGLDPAERGTLVHRALGAVWSEIKSHKRLCACGEEELAAIVRASVEPAMDWIAVKRGALPAKLAAIERGRIERLVLEWLAIERQRAPFTMVEFERERYAEAGGVRCKVKVDRVDRLDDGREVIIDYKTGRPAVRAWEGDRPEAPQLPLYAISHTQPVAAVLFGQVKVGEAGFKGYAAADGVAPGAETRDLEAEIGQWHTVLDRLGADFRAGVANVDPKDARACRRCSLAPLCRFAESETPASAFDEGNGNG